MKVTSETIKTTKVNLNEVEIFEIIKDYLKSEAIIENDEYIVIDLNKTFQDDGDRWNA